ncbi:MAG: hypothetical protein KC535_03665, partial [Nanoarchaeota archaeon]|nr:hypothetical protein [Nanoarchaeota archaeon]
HLLGKYTAEELKDGMRHKPAELAAKTHYYYPEEQKNIFAVNYYQPKTKKLDESIRLYHLLPLLVGASKTKSGIYTMANKISETTEPRVSIFADKNEAVLF